MNYWPSLVTNLADLTSPLYNIVSAMRETGAETARLMYNKTGIVGHHNTDMWGDTAPQDNYASATYWPNGLTWTAAWIYEQYRFTGDKTFLSQNYDTMTDLLQFYFDFLTEYNGWLVTNPSLSPENEYFLPNTDTWEALSLGPTIDNSLIWELCGNVLEASKELGHINTDYLNKVRALRERLPPLMINYFGGIQEWIEDYKEVSANSHSIPFLSTFLGLINCVDSTGYAPLLTCVRFVPRCPDYFRQCNHIQRCKSNPYEAA